MTTYRFVTRQLPEDFVRCRSVGHAWADLNQHDKKANHGGWVLAFRCPRCATKRFDWINKHGQLESRQYDYTDKYREAGVGTKGFPRDEFRRELAFRRYGRARRSA